MSEQRQTSWDTLGHRLKWWRAEHGMTLRDLQEELDSRLPEEKQPSFNTLSNYERRGPENPGPGPRAEVLAALKDTFPNLNLDWLVLGRGRPFVEEETPEVQRLIESFEEIEVEDGENVGRYRVPQWPTILQLPDSARLYFYRVLAELFGSASDLAERTEEERETLLRQCALTLQNLIMIPLHCWGFRRPEDLDERAYEGYVLALLQALAQAVHSPGQGSEAGEYSGSLMERLQARVPLLVEITLEDEGDAAS